MLTVSKINIISERNYLMNTTDFEREAVGYTNLQLLNIIKKIEKKKEMKESDKNRLQALKKEAWKRELEVV